MGYTTDFAGEIGIEPPLNEHEIAYLKQFAETRRMYRTKGPFFIGGSGFAGQGRDPDVIDSNSPHPTQPDLWCDWMPTANGSALVWNGTEKFYNSATWMQYLINTFLTADSGPEPTGWHIPDEFAHFTRDHVLNGVIEAQGEDPEDHWGLVVRDNVVATKHERPSTTGSVAT